MKPESTNLKHHRMKKFFRIPISVLLLYCVTFPEQSSGRAGSECRSLGPSKDLSAFEAVFSGELIASDGTPGLRFRARRVWKGALQSLFSVASMGSSKIILEEGEVYLVYATRSPIEGQLVIADCSRTQKLTDAQEDLVALGDGIDVAASLPIIATWDQSGRITIKEKRYIGDRDDLTRRIFRFPANKEVILEALGPKGFKVFMPSYLSLEAQNLRKIQRVGPGHRAVLIELTDQQQAAFVTADGVDSAYTELQIDTIYTLQDKQYSLAESKSKTGRLRSISDATGDLVGADLVDLGDGFTIKLSWSTVKPAPLVGGSWEEALQSINNELQSDLTPDPRCERNKAEPAKLRYDEGRLAVVSQFCIASDDTPAASIEAFPITELDISRVEPFVRTDQGYRISGVRVPCRKSGCGEWNNNGRILKTGSLTIDMSFKPGVAKRLATLLEYLVKTLQSTH